MWTKLSVTLIVIRGQEPWALKHTFHRKLVGVVDALEPTDALEPGDVSSLPMVSSSLRFRRGPVSGRSPETRPMEDRNRPNEGTEPAPTRGSEPRTAPVIRLHSPASIHSSLLASPARFTSSPPLERSLLLNALRRLNSLRYPPMICLTEISLDSTHRKLRELDSPEPEGSALLTANDSFTSRESSF